MNIIVSAGGRFHAHKLTQQLLKHNASTKLFTFDYTDNDTHTVPRDNVRIVQSCKLINTLFTRLRLERLVNRTHFNAYKDAWFDHCVAQQLTQGKCIDLFVVWANYALESIPVARSKGAKIILESGSCHIKTQQQLLEAEYGRWGVPFAPVAQQTIDRMCAEYEAADYIMTLSTFARQSFIDQGIDENKILMVPCGVDVSEPRIHSQQMTSSKKFTALFVGLVTPRKGIAHLLHAWQQANLPLAEAQLIIVGNQQKDFLSIKNNLPIANNVIFAGSMSKEKLEKIYKQASIFVLPSIEDGFGMVIGEAMGHGVPAICSTHTAGPDIITHGIDGWLVPPADATALAKQLTWCYNNTDLCTVIGSKAQQRIQNFSWDTYGKNVWQKYLIRTNPHASNPHHLNQPIG